MSVPRLTYKDFLRFELIILKADKNQLSMMIQQLEEEKNKRW